MVTPQRHCSVAGDRALELAIARSFLAKVDRPAVSSIVVRSRMWDIGSGRRLLDRSLRRVSGLIVTGVARAYTVRLDGTLVGFRELVAGSACGLRAHQGGQSSLAVDSVTDVTFLEFDRAHLLSLGATNMSLAWALAEELSRRLDDAESQLQTTTSQTVARRVANALLDMCLGGASREVHITQETLAECIGASRERVGHELRSFAERGLLSVSRGRVVLIDRMQLEMTARGDVYPRSARLPGSDHPVRVR